MTEAEYILIRDLSSVMNAAECLNHVIPENSPYIDSEELINVKRLLHKWREKMFNLSGEKIKVGK